MLSKVFCESCRFLKTGCLGLYLGSGVPISLVNVLGLQGISGIRFSPFYESFCGYSINLWFTKICQASGISRINRLFDSDALFLEGLFVSFLVVW